MPNDSVRWNCSVRADSEKSSDIDCVFSYIFLLSGPAISAAGILLTIAQPKSVWTAIGPGSPTLGFLISRNLCKQTWSMPIRISTNEVSTGGRLRSMRWLQFFFNNGQLFFTTGKVNLRINENFSSFYDVIWCFKNELYYFGLHLYRTFEISKFYSDGLAW